jgi:nucleoside-diphosphate-sugar epimerase
MTGTVGRGLLEFLEPDPAVERVIGVGTRPWSPEEEGYRKVVYRQADVRDRYSIRRALDGADAVAHLAFSLYGVRQDERTLAQINVEGSRNVLAAAAAIGARRFIYTSSAAVYGFSAGRRNRVGEDAAVDPAPRHFYSRQKARVEQALLDDLRDLPEMSWVFFRPCAVVGPHAMGAAAHVLPAPLAHAAGAIVSIAGAAGLLPAVPGPPVPLQFVHERDVGQAIHRALTSEAAGGIYNLADDGTVAPSAVPRALGLRTLPLPNLVTRAAVNAVAGAPYLSPALGWAQLLTRSLELDTSRARRELGWEPEFTSEEALAATRRALAI